MPKGYPPSIFVSSTCYDLNQVRADLKRFLESLGFDAILSETPAFPVTPQISPVENCLQAVKERADIFVLIVGARYGSQNDSGKSITNLEYLEAKAKGIPIYAFVSKPILNTLSIWRQNKEGNYTGIVDSPKLFDFVEGLRSSQDHWVFDFEEVLHITETLRRQLAYLFMEGLDLREKIKGLKLPPALTNLSSKALKFLMERPLGWEYSFFSSVLTEEMRRDYELKWDLAYRLKLGKIHSLGDLLPMLDWIQQKINEALALGLSIETLTNSAIQDALGKPGVAGNPEHLVYVARRVAKVRRSLLEWSLDFHLAEVRPECKRLFSLLSETINNFIEVIEGFPAKLDSEIAKAIEANKRGEKYIAEVMLTISTMLHTEAISAEFAKISTLVHD